LFRVGMEGGYLHFSSWLRAAVLGRTYNNNTSFQFGSGQASFKGLHSVVNQS